MSNYTKSTNFATKDNLSPGDPLKIVRGTEIDTEFNNISTAISTKTDNSAAAITGGSITGITDLAIADGGTGASTATAAINNLLPAQTSAANKYLQSDGTNVSWDAVTLSTADITGTLPVANGGTGITSFGTGIATFLGTPSSANLISAVTDETGSGALVFANTPTLVAPILGTPTSGNFSSGSFTWPTFNQNTTGTAAGLSATLAIASGGTGQTTANAAFNALAPSQTSASGKYLKSDGTNTSWDALDISTADITGTLPIANGGTGATTAGGALTSLGAYAASNPSGYTSNTGTVTSVGGTGTVNGISLSGTVTTSGNLTLGGTLSGVSLTSQVSGTLPTANGGTNLTSFTSGGVVYASSSSALATGSALVFDGTNLGVGVTPSAWGVSGILQLGRTALSGGANAVGSSLSWNAYYDTSWKYYDSLQASRYSQANGVHSWYSAPSGTAGDAISFTQVLAVEKDKSLALQGASSATGTGITFPATQSASSDANTLDDYEEGTWTPVDGSAATLTFTANTGFYTKIGNLVTAQGVFTYPVTATANAARVEGLPFGQTNVTTAGGFVTSSGGANTLMIQSPYSGAVQFYKVGDVTEVNAALSGQTVAITLIYRTT